MSSALPPSRIPKLSPQRSLRSVLVVPLVVQIFAVVGLTGYFAWLNGQRAVNKVASQLSREISGRIQDKLEDSADRPHLLNQINADAVRRGTLATQNRDSERYLWQQIQFLDNIAWLYFGSEQEGAFVGVTRTPEGSFNAVVNEPIDGFAGRFYALDGKGDRTDLINTREGPYDARTRPWYQDAIAANQEIWTDIYPAVGTQQLILSAALPVYDGQADLLGVVATDFSLDDISHILKTVEIGEGGQAFIMESSGRLVATSTDEAPYITDDEGSLQRLQASDSQDVVTRQIAQKVAETLTLEDFTDSTQLRYTLNGKKQFVQLTSFDDQRGIDWLVAVIIPESAFMAEIRGNTRTTILLCLASLLIATLVGWLTARRITQPVLALDDISKAITQRAQESPLQGSLTDPLHPLQGEAMVSQSDQGSARPLFSQGIREIDSLAASFSQMASQLQDSLVELEHNNEVLEDRIQQRTRDLAQAKEQADASNRAKSVFLASMSHELRTPLNAILGFSQVLLKQDNLTPEQQNNLAIIHRSGHQLLSIINEVLHLSKIEAGNTTLREQTQALNQLLGALEQRAVAEPAGLRAEDIAVMPDDWVRSLHTAALAVDSDRLMQLVQDIPTQHTPLKQNLENLIARFNYEQIVDATQDC